MKIFYDLLPIILFFAGYHNASAIAENTFVGQWIDPSQPEVITATIIATGIAIVASFIQVGGFWLKHRRFERMHIFSLVLISGLGGITIAFGDPAFIQWKPTVLNWVFAGAFLASQFIGEKNMVQRMQIEYGVNSDKSAADAGGTVNVPDEYHDAVWVEASAGGWANVVTVRLSFIMRSKEEVFETDVTKTYNLPGTTVYSYTPTDKYARLIYTATVNLRNRTLGKRT